MELGGIIRGRVVSYATIPATTIIKMIIAATIGLEIFFRREANFFIALRFDFLLAVYIRLFTEDPSSDEDTGESSVGESKRDRKVKLCDVHFFRDLGSSMSLKPSPSRLKESTANSIARPGNVAIHQLPRIM